MIGIETLVEESAKGDSQVCPPGNREENAKKLISLIEHDLSNGRVLYNSLMNHARLFVSNYQDREDIMSELFFNLIKKGAGTYRYVVDDLINITEDGNIVKWIHALTRNLCFDHLRRKKRRRELNNTGLGDEQEAILEEVSFRRGVRESLEDSSEYEKTRKLEEMGSALQNALQDPALMPKYREILILRGSGLTYRKIAEQLKIPLGTVQSRLYAAKKSLKI